MPLGETRTEPVVADDEVVLGELLVEAPRKRIVPLLLEVGDPLRAEDERRSLSDGGVGDPPAVELAEPNVLVHGPQPAWR